MGESLRYLITLSGLRRGGAENNVDLSAIDRLAREDAGASLCALEREALQRHVYAPLSKICGNDWAHSVDEILKCYLATLRDLALEYVAASVPPEIGRKDAIEWFVLPFVSASLHTLHMQHGGPDLKSFVLAPFTPLMAHILMGRTESVRALLEAGHDINIVVPESGITTLHCALWSIRYFDDDGRKLDLILEHNPAQVLVDSACGEWQEKPLWAAIATRNRSIVEKILKVGGAPCAPCCNAILPLYAVLSVWSQSTERGISGTLDNWMKGEWPAVNPTSIQMGHVFENEARAMFA